VVTRRSRQLRAEIGDVWRLAAGLAEDHQ